MPRITKAPEERRQEILDTAMKLFYEKGYEKTSITDIAKEMNVAQGLCYRYFPSKELLFDSAIEEYATLLVSRMTSGLSKHDTSLKQLIQHMPSFFEFETDDTFTYKFFHSPGSFKMHMQLSMVVCSKLVPIVKDQLDTACRKNEIELSDTGVAAAFIVYGQLGILFQADTPREERVKRVKTFLLEFLNLN